MVRAAAHVLALADLYHVLNAAQANGDMVFGQLNTLHSFNIQL
jgi:hypothetical protein